MNNLMDNTTRTARVIDTLIEWYRGSRDGVLSGAELPESKPPEGVTRGSYDHIMFLTLTVSIDYQRSATDLWDSARITWEDEDRRWVFSPAEIANRDYYQLIAALAKHKLSKKQDKDSRIWRTAALSFLSLFQGDPRNLFAAYSYDAFEIYNAMRGKYAKQFPYLAGATGTSKILSLWIRMLHDEARIGFKNLDNVPIPIDIHTARSTITTGCLVGKFKGTFKELVIQAQQAWRDACKGTKYYPLQLDEPLWNLSRFGCSSRQNGDSCQKRNLCRLADFCTANSNDAIIIISQEGTTLIDTNYPER